MCLGQANLIFYIAHFLCVGVERLKTNNLRVCMSRRIENFESMGYKDIFLGLSVLLVTNGNPTEIFDYFFKHCFNVINQHVARFSLLNSLNSAGVSVDF